MSNSRLVTDAPATEESPSSGDTEEVSQRPDRPIRLLVVDDDPRVRQAIAPTIALEPDLLMVGEANDAKTALELADEVDPSVALVDVLLSDDVTGIALVRSLNRRPGCTVVAMSVRGGLRQRSLAAGAVAFVEKNGDIDALLRAVRAAAAPRPV